MKKIIVAPYIYTNGKILSKKAILFDKKIEKIDTLAKLKKENKDAKVIRLKESSVLMPGLINAHVHLEFSSNKTTLNYGNFINWLYSVIEHREELMDECKSECITKAIDDMISSGITTIGAISSNGIDLEAVKNSDMNVIYFNELIGSSANMADALFSDFLARLKASQSVKRDGFIPAIAIHSPYSVHPVLIKKAIDIAKKEDLKLTAHFLESPEEREWLDNSSGGFSEFFKNFLNQEKAVNSADEFLNLLKDTPTLLTHAIWTNEDELETIKNSNHTIIHCPISNRLLGNGVLDIKKLVDKNIPWVIATDGLSSNYDLDLFEEMKISLFSHSSAPLKEFAKKLLDAATINPARALGLDKGEIKEGFDADMIVVDFDHIPQDEDFALHLILHRYNIKKVFIRGEEIR